MTKAVLFEFGDGAGVDRHDGKKRAPRASDEPRMQGRGSRPMPTGNRGRRGGSDGTTTLRSARMFHELRASLVPDCRYRRHAEIFPSRSPDPGQYGAPRPTVPGCP
jgi:hypothetical protein